MDLCNINRKNYQFIYTIRQTSQTKTVIIELGEVQAYGRYKKA